MSVPWGRPLCPSCGRPWFWIRPSYSAAWKTGANPHGDPPCSHRWHEPSWRSRNWRRSANPLPIPDGRLMLGAAKARRERRIRRHRELQGKDRR